MRENLKRILIGALVLLLLAGCASGKQTKGTDLVLDPEIRKGTLDNGMNYYVTQSAVGENRISLRLVVKAGSLMEEENEQGVAHFVEHMAFNGTEHFAKNDIVDYFETIGMDFGAELNAYTTFEETVYLLEIPADDESMLYTSLEILRDWASAITFDPEEIEKERGVVIEEWRYRDLGVSGRQNKVLYPLLLGDSDFGKRLPIGKPEIIQNVSRDEVLSFYNKWYRPEIMSVIVAGSKNTDALEKAVVKVMSEIPASDKKLKLQSKSIKDKAEKEIAVIRDAEQPYPVIQIFNQVDILKIRTEEDMKEDLISSAVFGTFNSRASEKTNSSDAAWLNAVSGQINLTDNTGFRYLGFVPKNGMFMDSLSDIFKEYERIAHNGITESEWQRKKAELLAATRQYALNSSLQNSNVVADALVEYVLSGKVYQNIEQYCANVERLLEEITLDEINEYVSTFFEGLGNRMFIAVPAVYEDVPSEEEILSLWTNFAFDDSEEYVDDSVSSLMEVPSSRGTIVSTSIPEDVDAIEYQLSNGIRIITKKSFSSKGNILFKANSKGGLAKVSDAEYPSACAAADYKFYSGFQNISYNQLSKFLAEKKIDVSGDLSDISEYLSGSVTDENLESLFQLIHLLFTDRYFSDDAWTVFMDNWKTAAAGVYSKPENHFRKKLYEMLFGEGNIRHSLVDLDFIGLMDPSVAERIYNERFDNPADFCFVFVGDFDDAKFKDLCEIYLGSLETKAVRDEVSFNEPDFPKGINKAVVKKGQDKKGMVYIAFGGKCPEYTDLDERYKDALIATQLGKLLDIRLREVIREDKSGTYGVGAYGYFEGYPEYDYRFEIQFGCEPSRTEELANAVLDTILELRTKGVSEENVVKLKEGYLRSFEANTWDDKWWLDKLMSVNYWKTQPSWVIRDSKRISEWITAENLQEAALKYLDPENYVSLFLESEE
ncbi:MAG: insulinase family protein [Treponema sp.]|nr:insulinase family protein [Treponema sp.]